MFLFGGLRPIASRLALDVFAIATFSYCSATTISSDNTSILLSATFITLFTAGYTQRWTITIPMLPIIILQISRHLEYGWWMSHIVGGLSFIFIFLSIALSIFFPAMELPPIKGKYNIGITDAFLPIDTAKSADKNDQYANVRIIYPTAHPPADIRYMRPDICKDYLRVSMDIGAPPPLNKITWFLNNWNLIHLRAARNADPLPKPGGWPIIAYSHGWAGSADIYSFQTLSLVANGYVVVSLNHSDGTNPAMRRKDGTITFLNQQTEKLWNAGKEVEYVKQRRLQADYRTRELMGAAKAFIKLNGNTPDIAKGVSFKNKLNTTQLFYMGHSFGGVSAIAAGFRQGNKICKGIIAHEPATDWAPDDVRLALMPKAIIEQECPLEYKGGTGGWGKGQPTKGSLQTIPMLCLFSEEWYKKKWGCCRHLEWLFASGKVKAGNLKVIESAHHQEFSDMCMLTPIWLARAVGVTGERLPSETAAEMHHHTLQFLDLQCQPTT